MLWLLIMLCKFVCSVVFLDFLIATILVSEFSALVKGSQKHEVFFKNLEVYSYRHFGSLQTIYFEIPLDSSLFSWNLMINKSRPACEDKSFLLYMQHGSFPIDQHDGTNTFPCTYKVGRTGITKDILTTSKTMVVQQPFYGQWFLGALMKKNENQVVKKLSSIGCEYGLIGNLTYAVEDVTVLIPGTKLDVYGNSQSNYFKFLIGTNVYKYSILLEAGNSSTCNVSITTRSAALPGVNLPIYNLTCSSEMENCSLEFQVYAPEVEKWQYILIQNNIENYLPPMKIAITLFDCMTGPLRNATDIPWCYMTRSLTTSTKPDSPYTSDFVFNPDNDRFMLVPRPFVSMTTFAVDKFKDIGGTLAIDLMVTPISADKTGISNYDIHLCIQRGRMTISSMGLLACNEDGAIVRLNISNSSAIVHFPYPEPGLYFIGHQDFNQSPDLNDTSKALGEPKLGIFMKVMVKACEDGKCQNGGECRSAMNAPFLMSYCYCLAGSRGITCADDTKMASRALQLMYTLMLSLSNLAFIPAIVISFKRWRYMECTIYFINMICSAFYHACDMNQWSMYSLCFLNYRLYQFADFFLSLLSFWVSLLAMSRIRSGFLIPTMVLGIIIIAILTNSNPAGPIGNVLPLATGVLIVVVSWGWKCFKNKSLYPSKKEYLWSLPGVLLAALGLIVFAFLETDVNYPYTHSFWHICVASSIPFILPRNRVVWELTEITLSKYTIPREFQTTSESDETVLVYSNNSLVQLTDYTRNDPRAVTLPIDDQDYRPLP